MTDTQIQEIKKAAQKTWWNIACDCESLPGWKGTHDEIWEMVGDRISFIGELTGEALKEYDNNYKEIKKISKGWF